MLYIIGGSVCLIRILPISLASILALLFILSGCAPEEGGPSIDAKDYTHQLTNEEILNNFSQVLSGEGYEGLHENQPLNEERVVKWADPMVVQFVGEGGKKYIDDVAEIGVRVEQLIGKFFLNDKLDNLKPNIIFIFTTAETVRSDLENLNRKGWLGLNSGKWIKDISMQLQDRHIRSCQSRFSYNESYQISKAVSVIFSDYEPALVRYCLRKGFAGILGLQGEVSSKSPSIFGHDSGFLKFTKHDEYLFQILYDNRIKPGMSKRQYMPLAKKILEERRKE